MRIAQVAPLFESVPPRAYGGTERVVSYLTEELVRLGHDVTLFASGDSITQARLVSPCAHSLRLDPNCIDQLAHHLVMMELVFREADSFDIVHFHTDYLHFPYSRRHNEPRLTTLHGRLDIPDLLPLYREFPDEPVVSISDSQRLPLPDANWVGTVYHGLPETLYTPQKQTGNYLAFLGRISPEKGVDRAIEMAARFRMPLRIAAKVDCKDREYFKECIQPLISRSDGQVEFLGEVGGRAKDQFLGGAYALLFPIDWPEPFGLVMIEAMACGTPVIAWRNGSVPEVLEDGVCGFIVDNLEQGFRALDRVPELDRDACRRSFERRFSASRMARDYLSVYRNIIQGDTISAPPTAPASGELQAV